MIYGNIILEQKQRNLDNLLSPIQIMEEYYQNEIELLNSTIEYQNSIIGEGVVTESDLEYLTEGFVGNIIEKIKELLKRFKEWLSNVFKSIANLFKSDKSSTKELEKKIEENKNEAKNSKTDAEVKKTASKACLRLSAPEEQKFPVIIERYELDKMLDEVSDHAEVDMEELNQLRSTIRNFSSKSEENIQRYIDKLEEDYKNGQEYINNYNYKDELKNQFLKSYKYNDAQSLQSATIKFLEHDKQQLIKLEKLMEVSTAQIKQFDNGINSIYKEIDALKNSTDTKKVSLISKYTNLYISDTKAWMQFSMFNMRMMLRALHAQIK